MVRLARCDTCGKVLLYDEAIVVVTKIISDGVCNEWHFCSFNCASEKMRVLGGV